MLKRQFEDIALCTYVIMDHLAVLASRAKSSAELGSSGAVRAVFFGKGSFTSLVESRVHGYAYGTKSKLYVRDFGGGPLRDVWIGFGRDYEKVGGGGGGRVKAEETRRPRSSSRESADSGTSATGSLPWSGSKEERSASRKSAGRGVSPPTFLPSTFGLSTVGEWPMPKVPFPEATLLKSMFMCSPLLGGFHPVYTVRKKTLQVRGKNFFCHGGIPARG